MISPAHQTIIEVDWTNACPNRCTSCTRLCGHHKKPFFITEAHLRRALESLAGFPGAVGAMGGEPTLHPEFEKFCRIFREMRPEVKNLPANRTGPWPDVKAFRDGLASHVGWKKVLFTSLGESYYRHFEVIQETFGYQGLNDHQHDGEHISSMITRKSLGISDAEWISLRDNCWLQRTWSAAITPHGAYFCEQAGHLDLLFNGGKLAWKVEKNWWQRTPKEFGDQLQLCEMCSQCLSVPWVRSSEETDIVSADMLERLKTVESPKVKAGKFEIYDPEKHPSRKVNHCVEPYVKDNSKRISRRTIQPRRLEAVTVCVGYDDYLALTIRHNKNEFDRWVIVTDATDARTQALCKKEGVECVASGRIHENGAVFAKGKAVNDGLCFLKPTDWIVHLDADVILPSGFKDRIKSLILNPGAFYYTARFGGSEWNQVPALLALCRELGVDQMPQAGLEASPSGYFQMFHRACSCLAAPIYAEGSVTAEYDDLHFHQKWPEHWKVRLPAWANVLHLPHGFRRQNWSGRRTPRLESELAKRPLPTRWICHTPCFVGGKFYRKNEEGRASDVKSAISHFKPVLEAKHGF
ncbi:MAG: hypothetical protein PHV34_17620 [Verrucomicrobiae bacterium]|nr:hypothetical protein [Verrucomicrobiae bacterium]